MDLPDRSPLLVLQLSLTIFADRTALIGLIHRIHALGLGTSWDSAQHFTTGFTATLLTRRNLKHKSSHLLTLSLNALLKCAITTFPLTLFFPSPLFPPHFKTNAFCGLNNAESKAGLLQNYRTTAEKTHRFCSEPVHQMVKSKGSWEQEHFRLLTQIKQNFPTTFLMNFQQIKFII